MNKPVIPATKVSLPVITVIKLIIQDPVKDTVFIKWTEFVIT